MRIRCAVDWWRRPRIGSGRAHAGTREYGRCPSQWTLPSRRCRFSFSSAAARSSVSRSPNLGPCSLPCQVLAALGIGWHALEPKRRASFHRQSRPSLRLRDVPPVGPRSISKSVLFTSPLGASPVPTGPRGVAPRAAWSCGEHRISGNHRLDTRLPAAGAFRRS